jgi:hypothetical protein
MKAKTIKGMTLQILFVLAMAVIVSAQDKPAQKADAAPQPQQAAGKEYLGPTADSIRPYRSSGRDPFKRTVIKPKTPAGKLQQTRILGFPTLDVRRAEFRQKVEQARARDGAEPDPVSQYLVAELDITGVFRDDRGFGAFMRAGPTGTMFFVRNGAKCYNGEVMRIGGDGADSSKVMFREVSYKEVNGKQSAQERMVTKAAGEKK